MFCTFTLSLYRATGDRRAPRSLETLRKTMATLTGVDSTRQREGNSIMLMASCVERSKYRGSGRDVLAMS
jgi:hypothetical protein